MARFITINGPLGIGKTWTVNRLTEYFGAQGVLFQTVNFQEPIKLLAYQLLGIQAHVPYDQMKVTKYMGFTGRQWIIQISESMKQLNPTIWVEKATNQIDAWEDIPLDSDRVFNRIYVADSQGFDVEMNHILDWSQQDGNEWLPICIEPPEKKHKRGQKWQDDDSRFNLAHRMPPGHVLTDSNDAYWFLKNEIQRRGWA